MDVYDNGTRILEDDCTTQLFPGKSCKTYAGDLGIAFEGDFSSDSYTTPEVNKTLTAIGLGSVHTIKGGLYIETFAVPVDIAPSFLASLRDVGSLRVRPLAENGIETHLTGLPGLKGVRRIVGPLRRDGTCCATSTLRVEGTGFTNLSSFSGVLCAPSRIRIVNNPLLATLDGLNNLTTWAKDLGGPDTLIFGNNLAGQSSVAALSTLAGCPTTTLEGIPSSPSPQIYLNGCSNVITVSPRSRSFCS